MIKAWSSVAITKASVSIFTPHSFSHLKALQLQVITDFLPLQSLCYFFSRSYYAIIINDTTLDIY